MWVDIGLDAIAKRDNEVLVELALHVGVRHWNMTLQKCQDHICVKEDFMGPHSGSFNPNITKKDATTHADFPVRSSAGHAWRTKEHNLMLQVALL
ncbi:hypothetical protein HPB47_025596 [Ixodes persulcatus]|uniref:Uncharacterized protein n=1 Tax=Ixodes persulcatus TaxID=34615 RepID=A0AC60Q140_IXOPE|nr:hypothetical protein HPB47_025596 [Ixodes persulcatus]